MNYQAMDSCIGSFYVLVGGIATETFLVFAGLPQGSDLSVTMFLLHIKNELIITQNRPAKESNRYRNSQNHSVNSDLVISIELQSSF